VTGSEPNVKLQGRIEAVIRVLAPFLDLVIAAGDRTSRFLDRGQPEPDVGPLATDHQLPAYRASGPEPPRH
jgi:hypothetical protein